jgi:hypothetical protein
MKEHKRTNRDETITALVQCFGKGTVVTNPRLADLVVTSDILAESKRGISWEQFLAMIPAADKDTQAPGGKRGRSRSKTPKRR